MISHEEARDAIFTIRQYLKENPDTLKTENISWSNIGESELTRILLLKIAVKASKKALDMEVIKI